MYKRQLVGTLEHKSYLKKKREWYSKPENKIKASVYYKEVSKPIKYLRNFGKRYWLFWPMMIWFSDLPDKPLTHQKFYKRYYHRQYYVTKVKDSPLYAERYQKFKLKQLYESDFFKDKIRIKG